jgi:very-short-patch-repair endonuclease
MRNTRLARSFRKNASPAERRLWAVVRAGRLEGFKFRRQVPIDRYIVDFVCMDAKLVVELDGPSHQTRTEEDAARTAVLERKGYVVLRFDNTQVLENADGVALTLLKALSLARPRFGANPDAP